MDTQQTTALAERPINRAPVVIGERGLHLTTLDDAFRFSQYVAVSGLAPKGLEKPESVFVALQLGMELGLSPMASMQNIAVINGRPGIFGDSALALVRNSGALIYFAEFEINEKIEPLVRKLVVIEARIARDKAEEFDPKDEDEDASNKLREQIAEMTIIRQADDYGALCAVMRAGERAPTMEVFTMADAKKAGLLERNPVWRSYPQRMCKFRARGFALRDKFTDVLKGLKTTEELNDTPPGQGFDYAQPVQDAVVTDVVARPPVPQKGAAAIAQTEIPGVTAESKPAETTPPPAETATKAKRTRAAATKPAPAEPAAETPAAPIQQELPAAPQATTPELETKQPEVRQEPAKASTPAPATPAKPVPFAQQIQAPETPEPLQTQFIGTVEEWLQRKTQNPKYPTVLVAEMKVGETGEVLKNVVWDPALDAVCQDAKKGNTMIEATLERRKTGAGAWFWWVAKAASHEAMLV